MKIFFALLLASTLLTGQEFITPAPVPDIEEDAGHNRSQFLYVSGGINPLPTISLGYRKLYHSLGSDLSITGSLLPVAGCGKMGVVPLPGVLYKQLFFSQRQWKNFEIGKSSFYVGAQAGVYPLLSFTVNMGALIGWQFQRKANSDFFELGINPLIYVNKRVGIFPLGSLTYAFLF
jgi:hypothetical protein